MEILTRLVMLLSSNHGGFASTDGDLDGILEAHRTATGLVATTKVRESHGPEV